MAQKLLERSCERFRSGITEDDDNMIRATSLEDVKHAIVQVESQLAARQCLRNLDRLTPYLEAIQRYGKVVEVLCNPTPLLPYIWVGVHWQFITDC